MSRGLADNQLFDCCLFCGTCTAADAGDAEHSLCGACGSPLRPAARQRDEHSLRRMLPRFSRHHPLDVYKHWPLRRSIDAKMRDLSLNGLQFSSPQAFIAESIVKIDCELLKALARVTYSRPAANGQYLTGVEFLRLELARMTGTFVSTSA
ncbi:MAG: PilZ domain-containing protein [Gammaproteobacteria bacterium]|nr:PilZ domain-containing protein [Gammaproteobacteria bacterium]